MPGERESMSTSPVTMDVERELQNPRTRETLLAAVERVRPVLEANADEAEHLRTLPEAAWRALHDEGLFVLKAPRELGGLEADPPTQIEIYESREPNRYVGRVDAHDRDWCNRTHGAIHLRCGASENSD